MIEKDLNRIRQRRQGRLFRCRGRRCGDRRRCKRGFKPFHMHDEILRTGVDIGGLAVFLLLLHPAVEGALRAGSLNRGCATAAIVEGRHQPFPRGGQHPNAVFRQFARRNLLRVGRVAVEDRLRPRRKAVGIPAIVFSVFHFCEGDVFSVQNLVEGRSARRLAFQTFDIGRATRQHDASS